MATSQDSGSVYFQMVDNLREGCCIQLRLLFQRRWEEESKAPWNEEACRKVLLKKLYLQDPIQRSYLENAAFESFDISLLSQLLLKFAWNSNKIVGVEKRAIQYLRDVRNQLAHKDKKSLNEEEYKNKLDKVTKALESIGVAKAIIEKMVQEAKDKSVSLKDIITQIEQLTRIGDEQVTEGRCKLAIDKYNEAISLKIPTLPSGKLSILKEKRGWAYYLISKNERKLQMQGQLHSKAVEDAKGALKLNKNSWKAHHIIGMVYMDKFELDKALNHLRRAHAISPTVIEVKDDLAACSLLADETQYESHLNPSQNMTLSEYLADISQRTGDSFKMTQYLHTIKLTGGLGAEDYLEGTRFENGTDREQSYVKAAGHYKKAMDAGNLMGMLALAKLYQTGKGVKVDLTYAANLIKEIACRPVQTSEDAIIVHAQTNLGNFYRLGVGIEQNYEEALHWFKLAAKNGGVCAKLNLGSMYNDGLGVPRRDRQMAKRFWTEAFEDRSMGAAYMLHRHYLAEMEPKESREYLQSSIELGNTILEKYKESILARVNKMEEERQNIEGKVIKFERDHDLPTKGITFLERQRRMKKMNLIKGKNPERPLSIVDLHYILEEPTLIGATEVGCQLKELGEYAIHDSKTDYYAHDYFLWQLNYYIYLPLVWDSPPAVTLTSPLKDKCTLMDIVYNCCASPVARKAEFLRDTIDKLIPLIRTIMQSVDAEESERDLKARLCYCSLAMKRKDVSSDVEVALERYPGEVALHRLLSYIYFWDVTKRDAKKHKATLLAALKLFPNDPTLLHDNVMRLSTRSDVEQTRVACSKFLECCEKDHPYRPGIYYMMGVTYAACPKNNKKRTTKYDKQKTKMNLDMANYYYELGLKAEECQIECLREPPLSKKTLEDLLKPQQFTIPNQPLSSPNREGDESGSLETQKNKRIATIKEFRKLVKSVRHGEDNVYSGSDLPNVGYKLPNSLHNLKGINLRNMTSQKLYEKRVLTLTLIEEPLFSILPAFLLGEDENGDVTFVTIHNLGKDEAGLRFGSRISIVNPYKTIFPNWMSTVSVMDSKRCVMQMGENENMCRYCGKTGRATMYCNRCGALYCSKDCQEKDWKVLKHKYVCVEAKKE